MSKNSPPLEDYAFEETHPLHERQLELPQVCRELLSLTDETDNPREFYATCLHVLGPHLGALYASIHIILPGQSFTESWNLCNQENDFWDAAASQYLAESLMTDGFYTEVFKPRSGVFKSAHSEQDLQIGVFVVPINSHDGWVSGSLVVFQLSRPEELQDRLGHLNLLGQMVSGAKVREQVEKPETMASLTKLKNSASFSSGEELAIAISNQLKNKSGSNLVALGQRRGNSIQLLAVSGIDSIQKYSPGIDQIRQAMEECHDLKKQITFQQGRIYDESDEQDKALELCHLHQQWSRSSGNDCVSSIPLKGDESDCDFFLSMRRHHKQPYNEEELSEYAELVQPYVETLDMVCKANRSLFSHTHSSFWSFSRRLISKGQTKLRVGMILLLLGIGYLAFGEADYELSVPCELAAQEVQILSAPQNGVLLSSFLVAGDRVSKGDLMCQFDDRPLRLERDSKKAELRTARLNARQARESDDRVNAQLAMIQIGQLQASISALDLKIAALQVRAPIGGVVIDGDLRKRVGDNFSQGAPLFSISQDTNWRIDLQVPEDQISQLAVGSLGQFSPFARPEESYALKVLRISPSSSQHELKNVYTVEAELIKEVDWLKVGMKGRAHVEAGRKPVWWVNFHGIIRFVRVQLWL